MAILRIKRLIEDLENNTSLELSSLAKKATTAGNAGSSSYSTTAGQSGTSYHAGSAETAGWASTAAKGTSGSQL